MVAYAASVAVLATTAPLIYTTALTVGSWVPARHQVVLGSQSVFGDVVVATSTQEDVQPVAETVSPDPTCTRPLSLVTSLFHLLAIADTITSSGSFAVHIQSSAVKSTFARNRSCCHRLSSENHTHLDASSRNLAASDKDGCRRQGSTEKRTKNGSCRRPAPPNKHRIFPHRLSSTEKPSPVSGSDIPAAMASPLSNAHNASVLFNIGGLLEMG